MKKPYIPALVILAVVIIVLIVWDVRTYTSSPASAVSVTSPASTTDTSEATSTATTTAATASSTAALPVYTLAQIAQHSTAASCWLAIDGNVYDVTTFIPIHPGGAAILNGCGKDATTLFHSVPRHAEANAEETVAPKYLIGTLASQ